MSKASIKDNLSNIIHLVNLGQERGSYTLDEAVKIQQSVLCFTTNGEQSSKSQQEQAVITLVNALEKVQKKGNFSLQEAFIAYQAVLSVTGQTK